MDTWVSSTHPTLQCPGHLVLYAAPSSRTYLSLQPTLLQHTGVTAGLGCPLPQLLLLSAVALAAALPLLPMDHTIALHNHIKQMVTTPKVSSTVPSRPMLLLQYSLPVQGHWPE